MERDLHAAANMGHELAEASEALNDLRYQLGEMAFKYSELEEQKAQSDQAAVAALEKMQEVQDDLDMLKKQMVGWGAGWASGAVAN